MIQLPDGRIGTICWNHFDGTGGVWGRHVFEMPDGGFGDLPSPEFMLRKPERNTLIALVNSGHRVDVELVGEDYTIIEEPGEVRP
ncbi:MAG TPA: hypothetical protein VLH56_19410 [Dissulfurispiraceae bacterium]|nr:hypothetical protein [Dissulfurispiraceae bacterium]